MSEWLQRAISALGVGALCALAGGCGVAGTQVGSAVPSVAANAAATSPTALPSAGSPSAGSPSGEPSTAPPVPPSPLPTRSPTPDRPVGVTTTHTLGSGRTFVLHRSALPSGPRPLVVLLHPAWRSAAWMRDTTGFSAYSDVHGFDVAYGEGEQGVWNAGGCCGGAATDDVAYLQEILAAVDVVIAVDHRRRYLVGMSNGGMLAYRALCELPGVFAAAGVVAGALLNETDCTGTDVHVHMIHGESDYVVPPAGGVAVENYDFAPLAATAARVGARSVIDIRLWGGGHVYPMWATDELWTWLSQWSLPGPIRPGQS